MLIFLITTVFALTEERKDEYCYLFSSNLVQGMVSQIESHVSNNPDLSSISVTSKAIEKAFYSCLLNLKEEHVKKFNSNNINDFSLYEEFISLDLESFKTPDDLRLTKKFNERRRTIADRARKRKQEKLQREQAGKDL